MSKCSVLISSCDKYEDLWDPFFQLLETYWKDCEYDIFLSTETKKYDSRKVRTINPDRKDCPWGERLKDALGKIETEYVIWLLDDYFLTGPVLTGEIEQCIEYMDCNSNIAAFFFIGSLSHLRDYSESKESPYDGFYYGTEDDWKCVCVPAIWRRDTLNKYVRKHESPWGFEKWGSIRAKRYPEAVYYEGDHSDKIYPYLFADKEGQGASAVVNGKWVIKTVEPFFREHNIRVDYSKMGVITIEDYLDITMKDICKRLTFKQFVSKAYGVIKSLI